MIKEKNIRNQSNFNFPSRVRSFIVPFQRVGVILLLSVFFLSSCKEPEVPTIVVVKSDDTYSPTKVRPVLDEWQYKTFTYFYNGASPTGLALEGNDRGDGGVVTIGGSGFGVMALIVGVERGWITRQQAAEQTQKIVRFLGKAERFKGAWAHWYNPDGTSHPFGDQVKAGDLVETSYMIAGLLTATEYYTDNSIVETEIRDSVASFWNTVNWRFYAGTGSSLNWIWYSQENRLAFQFGGWNETWICYILALAAPEPHNISQATYNSGWLSNGGIVNNNRKYYDYDLPLGEAYGGPLFFAHYSFLGLNPKKIQDQYVNYWKQNVAHAMINRHYCVYVAPSSNKYSDKIWGLTACDGAKPPLWNYSARSPTNDDGVIAPTAALASYPYTPFYSTQVLLYLAQYPLAQGTYGFADAFCPSTATSEKKHLAIDQGPIVIMMENYRSGLIWNLTMKNEHVKQGLLLAGVKEKPIYKEGFTITTSNTNTKEFDMMLHPDRGVFELDYALTTGGNAHFIIKNTDSATVKDTTVAALAGENTWTFNNTKISNGKQYTVIMTSPDGKEYQLIVRLR